jgi:hypothetical protein
MSTSELDVAAENSDPAMAYENELIDFSSTPKFFDKSERKSNARVEFKKKSGLSDEQIEGWNVMFLRNVSIVECLIIAESREDIGGA